MTPFALRLSAQLVSGLGASLPPSSPSSHSRASASRSSLIAGAPPHPSSSKSILLTTTIALIPIAWHIPGLNRLLDTRAAWLTWIPSHPPAALSFVFFVVAFSSYGYGLAVIIQRLMTNPLHWTIAVAALTTAAILLPRKRRSHWGHEPFTFSDDGDPTVQVTGFAPG